MDIGKGFFLLCFPSLWSPWQVQVFIEIDCPGETSPERDCWLWQSNSMEVCNSWLQAISILTEICSLFFFSPFFFLLTGFLYLAAVAGEVFRCSWSSPGSVLFVLPILWHIKIIIFAFYTRALSCQYNSSFILKISSYPARKSIFWLSFQSLMIFCSSGKSQRDSDGLHEHVGGSKWYANKVNCLIN